MNQKNSDAPGAPGIKAKWTSGAKSGLGKALNASSEVAFTISHGILNEVYFPKEDIACIKDLGFIVTDGMDFFSEEKVDANHEIKTVKNGIPAYKVINSCKHQSYKIIKEIVADPFRDTVLQKVTFKAAHKNNYHLYALLAPHLENQGSNNSAWIEDYKGIPMLFAQRDDLALALACSSKWLKRSAGYAGHSDGWTDLHEHKKMEWEYENAKNGNVVLTGEIDIQEANSFILALSFGRSYTEAANHAWSSILDGFDSAKQSYVEEWEKWLKSLHKIEGKNYRISAAVLHMHEAKTFPGGLIASMSIPWGETKGDSVKGGYHVVWPRDLVESAGGFLALRTKEDAIRIVNYLMSVQNADGSWPQNMWLDGTPHWKGI